MEEGELKAGTTTTTTTTTSEELYKALHQRLVASGEWQRLAILLRRMLDECGWATSLHNTAANTAKRQNVASVPELVDVLTAHAKDSLPPHVKTHLLDKLSDFLDRNLEDA
ncbi:hypothetical protein NDA11_007036 [Ustilago hordei]|nr:hypothetical protein NDA11_007036 [Ustilago hordei]